MSHASVPADVVPLTRYLSWRSNFEWRVPDGPRLTIPAGWFLWMMTAENEGVERDPELGPQS